MLVLSRKSRESVVVGGAPSLQPVLKVTVLEIRGGKVKLGFEADPSIPVQRSEVWEKIRAAELPDGHTDDLKGLNAEFGIAVRPEARQCHRRNRCCQQTSNNGCQPAGNCGYQSGCQQTANCASTSNACCTPQATCCSAQSTYGAAPSTYDTPAPAGNSNAPTYNGTAPAPAPGA